LEEGFSLKFFLLIELSGLIMVMSWIYSKSSILNILLQFKKL